MSVFVQPTEKKIVETQPEQKPQPTIEETFMVKVRSADCRCAVTAVGDLESGCRHVIPIRKCNGSHDAKMVELAVIARRQMLRLLHDVEEAREPV